MSTKTQIPACFFSASFEYFSSYVNKLEWSCSHGEVSASHEMWLGSQFAAWLIDAVNKGTSGEEWAPLKDSFCILHWCSNQKYVSCSQVEEPLGDVYIENQLT